MPAPVFRHILHLNKKEDLAWQDQARCRGNTEFLAEFDDGGLTFPAQRSICGRDAKGRKTEDPCPVIDECLGWALNQPTADIAHHGLVYGGIPGTEVARIQRGKKNRAA